MTWRVIVDIQQDRADISLLHHQSSVAHHTIPNPRHLSTALLPTLEELATQHDIQPSDIHAIDVHSPLPPTSLSVRIARTIAKTFLMADKL